MVKNFLEEHYLVHRKSTSVDVYLVKNAYVRYNCLGKKATKGVLVVEHDHSTNTPSLHGTFTSCKNVQEHQEHR